MYEAEVSTTLNLEIKVNAEDSLTDSEIEEKVLDALYGMEYINGAVVVESRDEDVTIDSTDMDDSFTVDYIG